MRVATCPVCGAAEFFSTGPKAPAMCASAGATVFEQPGYCIRECARCGLLYRDETLSSNEFARYYAATSAERWEIAGYFPTEAAVLARLKALPRRSRILDFGCSSGRLLAGLTSAYQCFGIEINAAAAKAAAAKGLQMIALEELEAQTPFNAVVLVDVFEHLTEPLALLRQLVAALPPKGVMIVVTGNGDSAACRRDPAQFWYFRNLEHVAMLTHRTADFVADNLNLRITEWTNLRHYDLSVREQLVQRLQNFLYWQFRNRAVLAQYFLGFLPFFSRLRQADVAPVYSCTRDHVLAIFERA